MEDRRPSASISGLPGPLSELPWSPDFVMQAIEILVASLREGEIVMLRPDCAESFIVGWPAGARPEQVAVRAVEQLGMEPMVLHSTSWRHDTGEVVLTYLAIVPAEAPLPESWEAVPVPRVDLARGDATTPPAAIGILQVLEHALRHLAWLRKDDPVVGQTLAGWEAVLAAYVPEPFRAFGEPG